MPRTPPASAHAPHGEVTETVLISPPSAKNVKLNREKEDTWSKADIAAWAESSTWKTENTHSKRALPAVPGNVDDADDDALYTELVQMQARIDELEAIRFNQAAEIAELAGQLAIANAGESPLIDS